MTTSNTLSSRTVELMQAYERAHGDNVKIASVMVGMGHDVRIVCHGKRLSLHVDVSAHKVTYPEAIRCEVDRVHITLFETDVVRAIGAHYEITEPAIIASRVFSLSVEALRSRGLDFDRDSDTFSDPADVTEFAQQYAQAFVDEYIDQGIKAGLIREKGALE